MVQMHGTIYLSNIKLNKTIKIQLRSQLAALPAVPEGTEPEGHNTPQT